MADKDGGTGGTSNVATVAIVVLIILVILFLIYFFGFSSRNRDKVIETPNFNTETPILPGTNDSKK